MGSIGERRSRAAGRTIAAAVIVFAMLAAGAALLTTPALAQEPAGDEVLRVVTTEIPPFVERNGDRAGGFYVEIWEDVAVELGVDFELIWAASYPDMIDLIESGQADIAVAPLAPTAVREARIDFTSAVITSGPQLGVHDRALSRVSLIRTLLGSGALRVLLFALFGLVILGHVIWLVERRDKDISDFHTDYPRGVFDGIWWAAVTVTTVGYGDMSPKSVRGRVVGILAMLLSLFLVGAFVSQVTSDLEASRTEQTVQGLGDVDGRQVGTVAGSTFETFLIGQGVNVSPFATQIDAFEAAEAGDVDIVAANPFALAVLGADYGIVGVGDVLYEEFETFGVQQDSPWREPINGVLADLQASGQIHDIVERWID